MKKSIVTSLRILFALGLPFVSACTTGTDVPDEPTSTAEDRARLDRIALIARQLVEKAHAQPQKPASALVEDLGKIVHEAESP
jgi:hypothetical protein